MNAIAIGPYCGKLVKFVNRIYSVSEKDRRVPRLPREFIDPTEHDIACLRLLSYIDWVVHTVIAHFGTPGQKAKSTDVIGKTP